MVTLFRHFLLLDGYCQFGNNCTITFFLCLQFCRQALVLLFCFVKQNTRYAGI